MYCVCVVIVWVVARCCTVAWLVVRLRLLAVQSDSRHRDLRRLLQSVGIRYMTFELDCVERLGN